MYLSAAIPLLVSYYSEKLMVCYG